MADFSLDPISALVFSYGVQGSPAGIQRHHVWTFTLLVWFSYSTDVLTKDKQYLFFKAIWQDITYLEAGSRYLLADHYRSVTLVASILLHAPGIINYSPFCAFTVCS